MFRNALDLRDKVQVRVLRRRLKLSDRELNGIVRKAEIACHHHQRKLPLLGRDKGGVGQRAIFRSLPNRQSFKVAIAPEALQNIGHGAKATIQRGREPDMPLGVIASLTREAPHPALALAFLVGRLVGGDKRL